MRQRRPDGTPKSTATRYVLVKWKGYELDVGDARRNGGWERYDALAHGSGKRAAEEAWREYELHGGKQEVEEASEALSKGMVDETGLRWLQAVATPAKKGGKKGRKK
jgi:hypothetical protein